MTKASAALEQGGPVGSLVGKVAIITGASSGIGEATAAALARAGVKVSLLARRQERLVLLANKLVAEGLPQPFYCITDVSSQAQVVTAVKEILVQFGHIDILINNAGVMYLGPIDGANPDDWKRMCDTNILGLMYCTHAVLPVMKEQESGHIVNISSVSGKIVTARSAVYSATKFAVGAFSEGLRQEVTKQGIRVTVVEPGAVLTELADHITHAETQKVVKDWVSGMSVLTSDDIANAIVYAISQPRSVNVNEIMIRPTDQTL